MKKITIISEVKDGRLTRNRNLIRDVIDTREGKEIAITFSSPTKKRTTPQNSYYWGVLIPIWASAFREQWGEIWTSNEVHNFLKNKFNFREVINERTGEVVEVPKSTTDNSTIDQEEYHEKCRRLCEDFFGVVIPLPNEDLTLNF